MAEQQAHLMWQKMRIGPVILKEVRIGAQK